MREGIQDVAVETLAKRWQAKQVRHMKRWWFSLVLLAGYLATFHLWLLAPPQSVALTGVAATSVLAFIGWRAKVTGYFVNLWDQLFHGLVILDVLLEAYIPLHEDYGFYACAAGFALTVGSYRAWAIRAVAVISDRRGV